MGQVDELYLKLPAHLQNIVASAAGWQANRERYPAIFHARLHEYEQRAAWSQDQVLEFAHARRVQALARASTSIFYSRLFADLGVYWHELLEESAFVQLPLTSKETVVERHEEFLTRPQVRTDSLKRTSGTTGASLAVVKDAASTPEQWAVWWRYRRWHGIEMGDWCALFASRRVMASGQRAPYWRTNWASREVRFSAYHLSCETAHLYVEKIRSSRTSWVHGYPSVIAILADLMIQQGLSLVGEVKAVTLGGEAVTSLQSELIGQAFGVAPMSHYGLTEGVANISMCPLRRSHVDEDFGYVEFVDTGLGSPSLVGTLLTNEAFALLRYDTGDLVYPSHEGACCDCGRPGRLVEALDGRSNDVLEVPGGRRISGINRAFQADWGIADAQVVQHSDGSITVRYVASSTWSGRSTSLLENGLRGYVGDDVGIRIERVERLKRTTAGKAQLVVREL